LLLLDTLLSYLERTNEHVNRVTVKHILLDRPDLQDFTASSLKNNFWKRRQSKHYWFYQRCLFLPSTVVFVIHYMSSPVCLSVVCNVRVPYSGDWNFQQCFYAIWYLGHPLTFTENFTEIVPGEPLRQDVKWKRGSQI